MSEILLIVCMNEQQNDLVSIILPVYNNQEYLGACLDSLLSQTYTNVEIIAIDDFSKDRSYSILRIYAKMDKRLKLSRNVKRYGKSVTLNRALKQAHGHYLTFMNPHDIWTKDKLRKQVQYLQDTPKTVAIGTQCVYLNEQKKRIGKSYFPTDQTLISRTIFTGFALHNESVLINTYLLPKDFLKFKHVLDKRFTYTKLFVKLLRFGSIANLDQQLYFHVKKHDYFFSLRKEMWEYILLWIQARFVYDLRLPLQSLLYPLVR